VAIKAPIAQFSKIGGQSYWMPPNRFLVVGDEILVFGNLPTKVRKADRSPLDKDPKNNSAASILSILKKADALGTKAITGFLLSKELNRRLSLLGKELNSTHVRMFSHPERGVVARLFDIRIGNDILLPRIKRIHASATLNLNNEAVEPFTITLSFKTFSLLPTSDLFISIYADGVLIAEPITAKFDELFICRDQKVCEPYTSFQHETLGRTVYFVSHPYPERSNFQ